MWNGLLIESGSLISKRVVCCQRDRKSYFQTLTFFFLFFFFFTTCKKKKPYAIDKIRTFKKKSTFFFLIYTFFNYNNGNFTRRNKRCCIQHFYWCTRFCLWQCKVSTSCAFHLLSSHTLLLLF